MPRGGFAKLNTCVNVLFHLFLFVSTLIVTRMLLQEIPLSDEPQGSRCAGCTQFDYRQRLREFTLQHFLQVRLHFIGFSLTTLIQF